MFKPEETCNPYQSPREEDGSEGPTRATHSGNSAGRVLGIVFLLLALLGLLPIFFVCTCTTVFTIGDPVPTPDPYQDLFAIFWWGTPLSLLLLIVTGYGLVRLTRSR